MNKIFPSLFFLVFLYTFSTSAGASQEFLDKMALLESGSTVKHQNYKVKNTLGYLGKYQFSKRTLKGLGFTRREIMDFLNYPELQESAMRILIEHNRAILFDSYKLNRYLGKKITGILITEEGLLAAAHLLGPKAVDSFVRSGGKYVGRDGYNTPITRYLKVFQTVEKKDKTKYRTLHKWRFLYDFKLSSFKCAYAFDQTNTPCSFVPSNVLVSYSAKLEELTFEFQHPKDNICDLASRTVYATSRPTPSTLQLSRETTGLQDYLDDLLTF